LLAVAGCGSDTGTDARRDQAGAKAATGRANLIVVDNQPLRVRGSGFKAREQVRVTAAVETRTAAAMTNADGSGAFTVKLRIALNRCQPLVLKAVGTLGTRASKDLAAPNCAVLSE
jgi:hypothetical protein